MSDRISWHQWLLNVRSRYVASVAAACRSRYMTSVAAACRIKLRDISGCCMSVHATWHQWLLHVGSPYVTSVAAACRIALHDTSGCCMLDRPTWHRWLLHVRSCYVGGGRGLGPLAGCCQRTVWRMCWMCNCQFVRMCSALWHQPVRQSGDSQSFASV